VRLEDLTRGFRVEGIIPGESVVVLDASWHGADSVSVVYRTRHGKPDERVLYRSDEATLAEAAASIRPFDADPADFRLAAEAQRISLAGLFDPMLAVSTSDVRPLPHQIRAVYGELLPQRPLRFLLADDPGAGKTIMAGLYIKELMLRDDVQRCLVVAPGGLVDQWQDELYFKFNLRFDLLSNALIDSTMGGTAFDQHARLIARMDQLARSDDLLAQLDDTDWDLVVIDEAHRMGAHYFGNKLQRTKRYQLGELLGRRARHLLLMTATPHSGKEEDYHLFLKLLDRDQFEGKYRAGVHAPDTRDIMRRMVKEDLLTFEGRPLFPERKAETVRYDLTPDELDLYEQVTSYVRHEMNRADKLNDKRRNTVGFALTVLQRRLASSPEAIFQSLQRRIARLDRRRTELFTGSTTAWGDADIPELDDGLDDYTAEELEQTEEELVDSATSARTLAELDAELASLRTLIEVARRVRDSRKDRKWTELRTILERPHAAHRPSWRAAQTDHLYRAPGHIGVPRHADPHSDRSAAGGRDDLWRRTSPGAATDHRGVHQEL
jgi:superfamily II DNA or RNA helicase